MTGTALNKIILVLPVLPCSFSTGLPVSKVNEAGVAQATGRYCTTLIYPSWALKVARALWEKYFTRKLNFNGQPIWFPCG